MTQPQNVCLHRTRHVDPAHQPRLLDLFSGEGGAALGYQQAGFQVDGVDLRTSVGRHYPAAFHHGDALAYAAEHWSEYDVIHASPPCQRYTHGNVAGQQAARHPDLIGPTRDLLSGLPLLWVIENVPRSPLIEPVILCGTMFGLTATDDDGTTLHLRRHRHFELHGFTVTPPPCRHEGVQQWAGAYGGARRDKAEARHVRHGGYVPARHVQEQLLGVPEGLMTGHGLTQSIPPAYSRFLGVHLRAHLECR